MIKESQPSPSDLSGRKRIKNPFERFMQTREERPDSIFLEDVKTGLVLTYSETAEAISGITGFLTGKKVKAGDRVFIVADNSIYIPLFILAASRIGAVFSVLSPQTRISGLREIFEKTAPTLIICDETEKHLEELLSDGLFAPLSLLEEARKFPLPAHEPIRNDPGPMDPAALVFTSGSTGDRKGIALSNDNILFTAKAIQKRLCYDPRDRILVVVPFSFDYGLYQIFLALESGACLIAAPNRYSGPGLHGLLARNRITVLPGVPSLFGSLLAMMRRAFVSLPELRIMTNTGEHLSEECIHDLARFLPQAAVFPMYGITECKRISILLPAERAAKPGSVGRCLPGTRAFVTDEARKDFQPHGMGELVVMGPHVTLGYWKDDKATSTAFFGPPSGAERGFFTGDLCTLDPDGFIYFHGRLDSLIKNKGHRISPIEIEKEALAVTGIVGAAAIQDPVGKRLHLFLVDRAPWNGERTAEIFRALILRLEAFKLPDEIHFLADLPLNPNGKIDRPALIALLGGSNAAR